MNPRRPNLPDIPCVILAGGRSSRFGSAKGLAKLNGQTLVSLISWQLSLQTRGLIALNAGPEGPYGDQRFKLLSDRDFVAEGPLAGILTAMRFARTSGYDRVITTPVDTPLIPPNVVVKFVAMRSSTVAKSAGVLHPICGIWETASTKTLEEFMLAGGRSVKKWVKHCRANTVDFPLVDGCDPFFNVNTTSDLEALDAKYHG